MKDQPHSPGSPGSPCDRDAVFRRHGWEAESRTPTKDARYTKDGVRVNLGASQVQVKCHVARRPSDLDQAARAAVEAWGILLGAIQ
jgi:hypothetical protein